MSHAPPVLPKAGSAPFKELWEGTRAVLDLPRTVLVLEGALDRKTLEEILQKRMRGSATRPGQTPRAELVGRLADAYHKDGDTAFALMKELDKSCHKERHIVASIDEGSVDERLATYRALDFRRERARMVWALLRDGRLAHKKAADHVLEEAFNQIQKAADAHAAADVETTSASGLNQLQTRLTDYEKALEEQQKEIRQAHGLKENIERERGELMIRLGQRERALREEEEIRRKADAENRRLTDELAALRESLEQSQPERLTAALAEVERLREKNRSLEQRAERAARLGELEAALAAQSKSADAERRTWQKRTLELEDALKEVVAREEAALGRAAALREELKSARRGDEPAKPAESAGGRVGVFLDAANLSASARRDFGSKLDYRTLLEELQQGRPKGIAVAYVVRDGDEGFHQGFVTSLRQAGYEVREKRPKQRGDGSRKADWDMGIAMEVLDHKDALDVVVLCSGDGDFVPLVHRLQRDQKRVEVAAFRASTDEALIKAADAFIALDGRFRMMT